MIRAGLRGEPVGALSDEFAIERSLPAGHVIAGLAMARRLALARLLDRKPSRERDICVAMILARAIGPTPRPAMGEALTRSTLAEELGLEDASEDDLRGALDWLVDRQARIEHRLARRHLAGRRRPLHPIRAWHAEAYCRGSAEPPCSGVQRSRPEWLYVLLCDEPGRPIAIDVLRNGPGEAAALAPRIVELGAPFGLSRGLICDRAAPRLGCDEWLHADSGVDWIAPLDEAAMRRLAIEGTLRPSLFDARGSCELSVAPGVDERLVACRDPLSASRRSRERERLLEATKCVLADIAQRVRRGALSGALEIRLAIGAEAGCRVEKHFAIEVADTAFAFARRTDEIDAEAALDGVYVLRTNVSANELSAVEVVGYYARFEQIEQAFCSCGGAARAMHPNRCALDDRAGAEAFLCMLSYYVAWHLRHVWAPLLLTEVHPPGLRRLSTEDERTSDAHIDRAHSYMTLLTELASLTRSTIRRRGATATFEQLSQPTPVQARALELAEHAPFSA